MKLVKADSDRFVFRLGKRERAVLMEVLRMYPLIPATHARISRSTDPAAAEGQQLLEEALSEQRRENKRQLEAMLAEPGRFVEREHDIRFTLKPSEAEWLLQVVNDIRVGSWLLLGSPGSGDVREQKLDENNMMCFAAMELCGYVEMVLLDALNRGSQPPS